jgi:hypothetical protein
VIRGCADPSASGPAIGALAHASTNVPIITQLTTPIRTHYLTVLAYNIMTPMTAVVPKATALSVFGIPRT